MSDKMTGVPLGVLLQRDPTTAYGTERIAFVEGYRDFEKNEVAITGRFSRNIPLARPFVASPMGTVTGLATAVRTALNGGITVLPYTLTLAEQCEMVAYIKRLAVQPGIIPVPFTLSPEDMIGRALDTDYSNIPITRDGTPQSECVGMYYRSDGDKRHENDPLRTRLIQTPESGVPLTDPRAWKEKMLNSEYLHGAMRERRRNALVVHDQYGRPVYLVTLKSLETGHSHPFATRDALGRLRVACAISKYDSQDPASLKRLIDSGTDALVIDTARGYDKQVALTIQAIKNISAGCDVIAGNYASRQGVRFAIEQGTDGLRIGQGIGSICTTPMANGVWMPQLSAVYETADEARENSVPVCADGGLQTPSDILAVVAAGAQSVMLGSRIAGTHESPAKIVGGNWRMKRHIGMGAHEAWVESNRNAAHHGSGAQEPLVEEGGVIVVKVTGHIDRLFAELSEGLSRSFHAIGVRNMQDLHRMLYAYEGPYMMLVDPTAFRVRGLHGGEIV